MGKIRSWLDEEITRHNRDVAFPDLPIQVEYRLDSSGTTSALTRHLSEISQDWKAGPGIGKTVIWPVGAGMPKGSGVIRGLKQVPGSIGYLSLTEAKTAGLSMAVLQNRAGQFVAPGLDSIKHALAGFNWTSNNSGTFVNDPDGSRCLPDRHLLLAPLLPVYQDPDKLAMLKELFSYGLQEGQAFSQEMGYVAIAGCRSQTRTQHLDLDHLTSKRRLFYLALLPQSRFPEGSPHFPRRSNHGD